MFRSCGFLFVGSPMHDTDNTAKKPQLLESIYPHSAGIMYAAAGPHYWHYEAKYLLKAEAFFAVLSVSCIGRPAEQEAAASEHGKSHSADNLQSVNSGQYHLSLIKYPNNHITKNIFKVEFTTLDFSGGKNRG